MLKRSCLCRDMVINMLGRGHREYKGPEVGEGLACSKDSEVATVAGESSAGRGMEGVVRYK